MIKKFDLYGPQINFKIDKSERLKTTFGGILTLLTILAYTFMYSLLGKDIINREFPSITEETVFSSNTSKIQLKKNSFFIAFTEYLSRDGSENYLSFNFTFIEKEYKKNIDTKKTVTNLAIKKCEEFSEQKNFLEKYNYDPKIYYCLDLSNVDRKYITDPYKLENQGESNYMKLVIYHDKEKILKKVANNYTKLGEILNADKELQFIYPQVFFSPGDFQTPFQTHPLDSFSISKEREKCFLNMFFSQAIIEQDDNFMFSKVHEKETKQFYSHAETTFNSNKESDPFLFRFELRFIVERTAKKFTRKYLKFPE